MLKYHLLSHHQYTICINGPAPLGQAGLSFKLKNVHGQVIHQFILAPANSLIKISPGVQPVIKVFQPIHVS
jgi:hypothetical protein